MQKIQDKSKFKPTSQLNSRYSRNRNKAKALIKKDYPLNSLPASPGEGA